MKQKQDELKHEGITDFEAYFTKHPKEAAECLALIRIIDANKYSVKLFNAKNKEDLLQKSSQLLVTDFLNIQELVNIASGMTYFEWEGVNKKMSGEMMNLKLSWSVAPGYEEDLTKVIISITGCST